MDILEESYQKARLLIVAFEVECHGRLKRCEAPARNDDDLRLFVGDFDSGDFLRCCPPAGYLEYAPRFPSKARQ